MNLYKFQTVNDNSISALSKLSLYFARTEQLNDPTENMFRLLAPNEDDKYSPDLSKLESMGVLSMAFGEPSKIEESPFMWAHYGNELKGFCLVFNFEVFSESIRNLVKHNKVKYTDYPLLLSGDNLINEDSGLEEVVGVNFKNMNQDWIYSTCFFQKPIEFIHENEYRFLAMESGLIKYSSKALSSIIIGEKMNDEDKNKLLEILKILGLLDIVKFAEVKENSFKIHITQSNPV
ncbi:TPA: DUF2971 domain-containing protein [Photobacterium damselae]